MSRRIKDFIDDWIVYQWEAKLIVTALVVFIIACLKIIFVGC